VLLHSAFMTIAREQPKPNTVTYEKSGLVKENACDDDQKAIVSVNFFELLSLLGPI
jgi:hypothetical protein